MKKLIVVLLFLHLSLTACGVANENNLTNQEEENNIQYNPVRYEGINGEMDNPNDGFGNFLMSDPNDPGTDNTTIIPDPNPFDENE
ncbi:hypothetical protein [Bacillus sp. AK128]